MVKPLIQKELARNIYLDLSSTALVKDLNELARCPWSGQSASMGKVEGKWQDTEYLVSFFGQRRGRRRNYQQYVTGGTGQGQRLDPVGGGLLRSLGGWSQVLAIRRPREKAASDQRILGDSEFVQEVISGLDDLTKSAC